MFTVGQRVCFYGAIHCTGTVEAVTEDYVRVHWDGNVTQDLDPDLLVPIAR